MAEEAKKHMPMVTQIPALKAQDVADSIIYALSVPPRVEINELTLLAKMQK